MAKLSTDQLSEPGAPEYSACFPWKTHKYSQNLDFIVLRKIRKSISDSKRITVTFQYTINLDLAWLWLRLKCVGDNGVTRFGNESESD